MDKKMEQLKEQIKNSESEAWADSDHVTPDGNVAIPSEEAVERAKEWAETNEL